MPTTDAFVSLVNLVNKTFLKAFYIGRNAEIEAFYRIFATMLADQMPNVCVTCSPAAIRRTQVSQLP